MITIHLKTSLFDESFPPFVSNDLTDLNESILVTYDLCNSLSELKADVNKYDEVLDIYLLESIIYLGKYHKRYFQNIQEIPTYGLGKFLFGLIRVSHYQWTSVCKSKDFWNQIIDYAYNLKKRAIQMKVWDHYLSVELPFSLSLFHLSKNGIAFQTSKIERILRKTKTAKQHLYNALEVNNLTGVEIKDLNDWIKGYGFNEYFPAYRDEISINDLALLEDSHQVFKIFIRIDKLKRIENFLLSLKGQHIVYPNYKMMGTATGRCTSNSPNVMGIPRIFRSIVIPSRDDFGIIECDYSQMEVGVAAALSCDTNLIKDFNSEDVYIKTSNWLFEKGKTVSRNKAKIMFLGIQYGLSNNTIAKRLEISLTETNEILNQFYERYHNLYEYLKEQERIGAKIGWVKSVSGLKRHRLDRSAPPNYWENNWFKNFPIQSSAASVFKGAINKIYQKFKDTPFNLLIPLYDSVVFEAPLKNIKEITNGVVECMVSSMKDYFPDLQPKVSVNDSNLSYWNAGENNESIDNFLKNPVYDIDIRDKPSSNVNWLEYL